MTIRHFQIFAAVVDNKTMHQAAESLYISQPSVSQAIRELEKHYQVKLFERYKRKLILTSDGEKLLKYCRVLLAQYEELNRAMTESREKPVLRIGATVSVGEELLVGLVTEFEREHPDIRTEIQVNNTEYVEEAILGGRLDVGVIEGQVVSPDITLLPFYQDCMQVVCAPDNPLAGRRAIPASELAEYDIITREQGSQVRNVLLNMLREQGIPVHIKWSCTNVHTIKQAVMAGQGISILSSLVVAEEAAAGRLCVLDVAELDGQRIIHLALHRDKHRSPALEAFLDFSCQYGKEKIQQSTDDTGA